MDIFICLFTCYHSFGTHRRSCSNKNYNSQSNFTTTRNHLLNALWHFITSLPSLYSDSRSAPFAIPLVPQLIYSIVSCDVPLCLVDVIGAEAAATAASNKCNKWTPYLCILICSPALSSFRLLVMNNARGELIYSTSHFETLSPDNWRISSI